MTKSVIDVLELPHAELELFLDKQARLPMRILSRFSEICCMIICSAAGSQA